MAYSDYFGKFAYAACKGYYGAFDSFWQIEAPASVPQKWDIIAHNVQITYV
jgi:drug/metabolite transporter superfamily protein YnfA